MFHLVFRREPRLSGRRPSNRLRQGILHIFEILASLIERRAGPGELPLHDAVDGIRVIADQTEAFLDRSVAGTPLDIRSTVSFSVFYVNVRDPIMVFADVGYRIVVAGCEMADVQTDSKLRGHPHQFLKTLNRRDFVRFVHLGMSMERRPYFGSFDKRNQPRPHRHTSLIGLKDANPQHLHLPEHRLYLGIGNVVCKSV